MKASTPRDAAPQQAHRLWWFLLTVLATGGCSGIQATKSVSPLDFLLPGLHMRNEPRGPFLPGGTNMLVCRLDRVPY